MKDKFTYFDFLAYFVPGAVLIWVCTIAAKSFGVVSDLETENIVTDSLIFVVMAFVVGHFIQFRSKQKTEATIKEKFWDGDFVSRQFLVKGNKFCPEPKRQRYIQLLQDHFGLQLEDAQILESSGKEEARTISDGMYRSCFTFITDEKIGEKAIKANEYYNFFRGLSTTSAYASVILSIDFIYVLVRFFVYRTTSSVFQALVLLLLAIFFGYAVHAFRVRAKQRGELHVAEVLDSMTGYFAKEAN